MNAVLTSLVAVAGTLGGSLGALLLQQRAATRAELRRDLRAAGAAFLAALTAYRREVYTLSTMPADTDRTNAITAVREARTALTTTRDALLLITTDPAVRDAVPRALDATFALGDDIEQDNVTTGRPAALAAHSAVLDALTAAIRTV